METTEKTLLVIEISKKGHIIRIVMEPAQLEEVPCRICGKTLKSEASRAAGIGPVCVKKVTAREKKPKTARKGGVADPRQLELDIEGPAAKGKPDSWQVYLERNADFLRGR